MRFNELVVSKNWNDLVARYPLRESKAFDQIFQKLECTSRSQYEQMVFSRVQADGGLADELREQLGPLSQALLGQAVADELG